MAIISIFFGMIIRINNADHNPPHIHVQYGEFEALIEIKTGKVMVGKIPGRLLKLIEEWRKMHQAELLVGWEDAQALRLPKRIKPLE